MAVFVAAHVEGFESDDEAVEEGENLGGVNFRGVFD